MNKLALVTLAVTAVAVAACSSTTTVAPADAGKDAASEGGGNTYAQTGQIVDFNTNKGVVGATVTAGSVSATTDATGKYTLNVPKDTAYSMTITAPNYLKLIEQEWKLTGDADRGKTSFVDAATQQTLQNALSGYDQAKAVFSMQVQKKGTCADVTGATITMANQGTAVLKYFKGGFPSNTATSVTDGQLPSAVIYNVTPGTQVVITVTHPTCKQVAFPVADPTIPTILYTGNVTTEGGAAASFTRLYVE
jgi:hypothetical protein